MIQPSPRENFLVLGAGSWGSALAIHLARQQHSVVLWGHNSNEMKLMQTNRTNDKYLPGFMFPANISLSADLKEAFEKTTHKTTLLIVVPSHAFADLILQLKPFLTDKMGILWGTKGLSKEGLFLHTICQQHCGQISFGVLSGPSFAKEVANGLPTAVSIATTSSAFGEQMVHAFHSDLFRVYLSQDLLGVQLGGVFKNVLAIAVGLSDGLGYGANARAALITRGLAEMCRLGEKMGAALATMMGLSGVGDVVLTCTDNQSRNRRFGLALGEGKSAIDAENAIGQVVEGKVNVKQILLLAAKHQIELPICEQVNAVLYEGLTVQQAVYNLLKRSPKNEFLI
ncbi:MAG: NAD(P)-dependent glycerol-3-phosphate dehydrogenase [Proteobacteria bacterium]|nr:NAD(P)-dependent glycerol-3-phosphate dehydrogenase [Pseudomonadota bacterium]